MMLDDGSSAKGVLLLSWIGLWKNLDKVITAFLSLLLLHNGWMKKRICFLKTVKRSFWFIFATILASGCHLASLLWMMTWIHYCQKRHKHVWVQLWKACGIWCARRQLFSLLRQKCALFSFVFFCKHRQKKVGGLLLLNAILKSGSRNLSKVKMAEWDQIWLVVMVDPYNGCVWQMGPFRVPIREIGGPIFWAPFLLSDFLLASLSKLRRGKGPILGYHGRYP